MGRHAAISGAIGRTAWAAANPVAIHPVVSGGRDRSNGFPSLPPAHLRHTAVPEDRRPQPRPAGTGAPADYDDGGLCEGVGWRVTTTDKDGLKVGFISSLSQMPLVFFHV